MATFCPCLKSLPEAKIKRFILIALTEEVLNKISRDFVFWFRLKKNKHSKLKKKKYKIHDSKSKEAPENGVKLNPEFKEINRLKILNKIKGVVTSGQDSTQLCFHLLKQNLHVSLVMTSF